jgi:hypothetical protein
VPAVAAAACCRFVADDASTSTRTFVIQGSDTIDHWRLNLTFDPVVFEDPSMGIRVSHTRRAAPRATPGMAMRTLDILPAPGARLRPSAVCVGQQRARVRLTRAQLRPGCRMGR